ncbi:MAG TPA: mercury resistance system periplasmic binding protein MerP [Burkholderiales bacterium]|nr:mercury resistance system periplasmic binding protein MerP [Burkholderiales bacterium]
MKLFKPFVAAATILLASHALAANKTVTLDVPGMYCEMCPITVKKALSHVSGVSNVSASYERKEAVVTFDDTKTSVEALTKATANAGYPSKARQ